MKAHRKIHYMTPFELFIEEIQKESQEQERIMMTDVDELLNNLELNIATAAWNRCLSTVEQMLQTLPKSTDPIKAINQLRVSG